MRTLLIPALILSATACTDGDGFGGDEPSWLDDGDNFGASIEAQDAPSGGADAELDATCDETSTEPVTESLTATGGAELITVSHTFDGNCCADWSVDGVVNGSRFEVTYVDAGESCDCTCPWTLDYTIEPVAPGDWLVSAGSQEASVTVTEIE